MKKIHCLSQIFGGETSVADVAEGLRCIGMIGIGWYLSSIYLDWYPSKIEPVDEERRSRCWNQGYLEGLVPKVHVQYNKDNLLYKEGFVQGYKEGYYENHHSNNGAF